MRRKQNRNQVSAPREKIAEAIALIYLQEDTLKTGIFMKGDDSHVVYRCNRIPPKANHGDWLRIHDFRDQAIRAIKHYRNKRKRSVLLAQTDCQIGKVVIMKKFGRYYINIFPVGIGEIPTAILREEVISNFYGSGFDVCGDPEWWRVGYHVNKSKFPYDDGFEFPYIALNDVRDPNKSLQCKPRQAQERIG